MKCFYYQHHLQVFVNLPQTVTLIDSSFFKIKINTNSERKNESVNQKHSKVVNFMFVRLLFECSKNKTNYTQPCDNSGIIFTFKFSKLITRELY